MEKLDKTYNEIQEAIEKYQEEQVGLPKLVKVSAPEFLNMPLSELRKRSPIELAEASLELNRYSMYVDRIINKHRSWERWAKLKLDEYTGHYLQDISSSYGFNERVLIAKTQPEPCKILNNFIKDLQMKITVLQNIPDHVKAISDCIREIRFINIKQERIYS